MKTQKLKIPGPLLIDLDYFRDERGFFVERYNSEKFSELGITGDFCQDNYSRSAPGVIRGLHFQTDPDQGKLVGVIAGKILDVMVDVRSGSPTFGQWDSVELDSEKGQLLWIPGGFAHGFAVLGSQPADVLYKVDQPYRPDREKGIRWNDPKLAIRWPSNNTIVSGRDQKLPAFEEVFALNRG